jgi:hypothetical protein
MQLLADDSERRALGQRAADAIRLQTGATARTLEALQNLLGKRDDHSRTASQQAAQPRAH